MEGCTDVSDAGYSADELIGCPPTEAALELALADAESGQRDDDATVSEDETEAKSASSGVCCRTLRDTKGEN